jgi:hypothetical protein
MRVESDREFWLRQLAEWRQLVKERKLQRLNTDNCNPVNDNAVNKSA